MQLWLTQFDCDELDLEEAAATTVTEYEAHIAALERKVGQLTMNWTSLKNTTVTTRCRQRELIHYQRSQACSIRRGCQVIDLPRSTYYYRPSTAESFMKTLKIYITRCETFNELATRLPYFIEKIYNERRMHSALDYQSPTHFEIQLALRAA